MALALRWIRKTDANRWARRSQSRRVIFISALVIIMFFASVIESAAWAGAYLLCGAISGLEQALYFSMVTYTTLGYGDVVLGEQWRLLASFEAANGIIMFGWTTAVIVAAVHIIYMGQDETKEQES